MTTILVTAFKAGRSTFQHIGNMYDRAGFLAMRALIDDRFLDIDENRFASPHLRKAATLANKTNDLLQDKLFKGLAETYAQSNVGPKPDFNRPLINLGGTILNNLGRMNVAQVAVLTLGVGVAVVAAYVTNHNGGGNLVPDVMSTYLGVKPNSNPEPKLEKA